MASFALFLFCTCLAGCGDGVTLAPVEGQVFYKGEPLTFGGIMFQPETGQPATGEIGPDGRFRLTTIREGDGATVGINKVRITCYESQQGDTKNMSTEENALGTLLIPVQYTQYDSSGLSADVKKKSNEPFVFQIE